MGPVATDELKRLIAHGEVNLHSDLVWTEGMANWQAPAQVEALIASPSAPAGVGTAEPGFNPYAAPITAPENLLAPVGDLGEITPGSMQLEVMDCLRRAVELTKRHFGTLLLIGIVYLVIYFVLGLVEGLVGGTAMERGELPPSLILIKIVNALISIVIGAGLTRAALNVSSGGEASIGDLFGQTGKILSIIGASLLVYLIIAVGFILLIVPGIYLAIRLSFFMTAIVDRNLGPVEALKYSWQITTNNALPIFGLMLLSMLIILAGVIALLVGLVFALPVVTLAYTLAYRFLQYGPNALRDRATAVGAGVV